MFNFNLKMILIHIPHSSTFIPDEYRDQFILGEIDLEQEAKIMADLFTDRFVEDIDEEKIIFPISRLVCDVERFRDDANEEMSKIGMGVVYKAGHDLQIIRKDNIDAEKIKKDLYDKHHDLFEKKVDKMLKKFGNCFIIDIHSYPDKALPYELYKEEKRPDICLGYDEYHIDKEILDHLKNIFLAEGYSVEENQPFKGAIVPLSKYRKDARVRSLMLEINKRTYLEGFNLDPDKFSKLKSVIAKTIDLIRIMSH